MASNTSSLRLPIDDALPDLLTALQQHGRAVLQAPPGAGKTTRVPLAMLDANLCDGRILMLEPRRLAARAAAERMSDTLGETTGQTIGYRMRGDRKISKDTRIEVVTEGILTRMLQSDPELPGVGAVIFDEFHERSLNADLGLAFCLEVASTLREDLMLLVMSATLDAAPVAKLMDAPIVTSKGRSFEVETRWLDRPLAPKARRTDALVDLILQAERETRDQTSNKGGGILVFLPGEGEIRRAERALTGRLPGDCQLAPLFGALPFVQQQAAIHPAASGVRKIVLATSIAETSLTIEDVRVVVDMGQARRARFDPGSGMSRLVTDKVTRAEATQRQGRAGRMAAGVCYRLWTKGEEGALFAHPPAEIEATDLTSLALELAQWGGDETELPFLTHPPKGSLAEARALLQMLGALDDTLRLTQHGGTLAKLPLHPRLAHMMTLAGPAAAPLAALMAERDPLRGAPVDLSLRLEALKDVKKFRARRPYDVNTPTLQRITSEAKRLQQAQQKLGGGGTTQAKHTSTRPAASDHALSPAAMAALAYPDRVAQRRKGDTARFVLSGGKGAILANDDPLAATRFLVVLDSDGNPREAKIRMAAQISQSEIETLFADQITASQHCVWSKRDRRVLAEEHISFGALTLDNQRWKTAPDTAIAHAMLDGIRDLGLTLTGAAARFATRVELVRKDGHDLPDFSHKTLLATLEDWLLPMLTNVRSAEDWKSYDLLPALKAQLDWGQSQILEREAPGSFTTPLGRKIPIDYADTTPAIEVRIQEVFGVTRHPSIGGTALKVTLLSPARRPIQITTNLPGFWAGSYDDVRKDMRAQYPRHPWPEDPTQADPTLRAKPRK